jgi:hypothetical protein
VPGVVEVIVAEADTELKPVLASFAQTYQPFLAFVFTVAVRGVGLDETLPVESCPRLSVLALIAKVNDGATLALTTIWSSAIAAVANGVAVSVLVVTVPVYVPAVPTVSAEAFVQLKQYRVPAVSEPLVNVTVWPEAVPVAWIVGHGDALAGHARLVVLVAQVADAPTTYPVGNVTATFVWPVDADLAQTVPVVVAAAFIRSKRTSTWERLAADAVLLSAKTAKLVNAVTYTAIDASETIRFG